MVPSLTRDVTYDKWMRPPHVAGDEHVLLSRRIKTACSRTHASCRPEHEVLINSPIEILGVITSRRIFMWCGVLIFVSGRDREAGKNVVSVSYEKCLKLIIVRLLRSDDVGN